MLEEKSRSWVIKSASKVSGESLAQVSVDTNLDCCSYTGAAPDAFFYVGTAGRPEQAGERGTLIQFPPGSSAPLGKYTGMR